MVWPWYSMQPLWTPWMLHKVKEEEQNHEGVVVENAKVRGVMMMSMLVLMRG